MCVPISTMYDLIHFTIVMTSICIFLLFELLNGDLLYLSTKINSLWLLEMFELTTKKGDSCNDKTTISMLLDATSIGV